MSTTVVNNSKDHRNDVNINDRSMSKILKAMIKIIRNNARDMYSILLLYNATNVNYKDYENDIDSLSYILLSDFLNLIGNARDPVSIFNVIGIKVPNLHYDLYKLVVELYNTKKFNFSNVSSSNIKYIIENEEKLNSEYSKENKKEKGNTSNNVITGDKKVNIEEKDKANDIGNNAVNKDIEKEINNIKNEVMKEVYSKLNDILSKKIEESNKNKGTDKTDNSNTTIDSSNTDSKSVNDNKEHIDINGEDDPVFYDNIDKHFSTGDENDVEVNTKHKNINEFKGMKIIIGVLSFALLSYLLYSIYKSKNKNNELNNIINN